MRTESGHRHEPQDWHTRFLQIGHVTLFGARPPERSPLNGRLLPLYGVCLAMVAWRGFTCNKLIYRHVRCVTPVPYNGIGRTSNWAFNIRVNGNLFGRRLWVNFTLTGATPTGAIRMSFISGTPRYIATLQLVLVSVVRQAT